jgi:hypothetical protein
MRKQQHIKKEREVKPSTKAASRSQPWSPGKVPIKSKFLDVYEPRPLKPS